MSRSGFWLDVATLSTFFPLRIKGRVFGTSCMAAPSPVTLQEALCRNPVVALAVPLMSALQRSR
jgi:hypothetical protein